MRKDTFSIGVRRLHINRGFAASFVVGQQTLAASSEGTQQQWILQSFPPLFLILLLLFGPFSLFLTWKSEKEEESLHCLRLRAAVCLPLPVGDVWQRTKRWRQIKYFSQELTFLRPETSYFGQNKTFSDWGGQVGFQHLCCCTMLAPAATLPLLFVPLSSAESHFRKAIHNATSEREKRTQRERILYLRIRNFSHSRFILEKKILELNLDRFADYSLAWDAEKCRPEICLDSREVEKFLWDLNF